MIEKLTGEAYIEHWVRRISQGPEEAGTERNGDDTWSHVRDFILPFEPGSILEFGCSWGRMLRRIHSEWPKARLYGVDLCQTALEGLKKSWPDDLPPKLYHRSTPPTDIRVDMIFTCTVIQHITDPDVLAKVFEGFKKILKPGGKLVMFENITFERGGGGAHMIHFGENDYTALWPELRWKLCPRFIHRYDLHGLMIGMRE